MPDQSKLLSYELSEKSLEAARILSGSDSPVEPTNLYRDDELSDLYGGEIYFADESRQRTGSYKIRGGFNAGRLQDNADELVAGSAGNHSPAVARTAAERGLGSVLFVPKNAPDFKVENTIANGDENTVVHKVGWNFEEANRAAIEYSDRSGSRYIHPFDDLDVIAGQSSVAHEVLAAGFEPDVVISPVGGGGFSTGNGNVYKTHNPNVMLYGVEPAGAASMALALKRGYPVSLVSTDPFVDGASVAKVGEKTLLLARHIGMRMLTVSNTEVMQSVESLWEKDIKAEKAAALSVAALRHLKHVIKGKSVLCNITGGNYKPKRTEPKTGSSSLSAAA